MQRFPEIVCLSQIFSPKASSPVFRYWSLEMRVNGGENATVSRNCLSLPKFFSKS